MRVEIEKLENINLMLKKLSLNSEECWYLLKSLASEMDRESEFMEYELGQEAWEHITEAVDYIERLKDTLSDLSIVLKTVPEQYKEWNHRYSERMEQIGEYIAGWKSVSDSLSSQERRQPAGSLLKGELSSIHQMLKKEYHFKEVRKDDTEDAI